MLEPLSVTHNQSPHMIQEQPRKNKRWWDISEECLSLWTFWSCNNWNDSDCHGIPRDFIWTSKLDFLFFLKNALSILLTFTQHCVLDDGYYDKIAPWSNSPILSFWREQGAVVFHRCTTIVTESSACYPLIQLIRHSVASLTLPSGRGGEGPTGKQFAEHRGVTSLNIFTQNEAVRLKMLQDNW